CGEPAAAWLISTNLWISKPEILRSVDPGRNPRRGSGRACEGPRKRSPRRLGTPPGRSGVGGPDMVMITVTAWSLGAATILNSPTPQSTTPPCHAYPLNAGDECRRCMDDACDNFQKDWGLCHGNSLCQATVRLLYELAL